MRINPYNGGCREASGMAFGCFNCIWVFQSLVILFLWDHCLSLGTGVLLLKFFGLDHDVLGTEPVPRFFGLDHDVLGTALGHCLDFLDWTMMF